MGYTRTIYNNIFEMFFIVLFLMLVSQTQCIIYVMRAFLEDLASCTEEANAAWLTLCGCLSEASSANVPWHRATEDAMADPREASRAYMMRCYPWRCLCLGFSQITITRPCLLMTLHLSHIGLTDALTFIVFSFYFSRHVILPLVRSYGDSSTLTLSPGRIRM